MYDQNLKEEIVPTNLRQEGAEDKMSPVTNFHQRPQFL